MEKGLGLPARMLPRNIMGVGRPGFVEFVMDTAF